MTPAARVAAAIDLLDAVFNGQAAEQALTAWARKSRFAGSKDRAAVRDHVFQALRCKSTYAARGGAETGRGVMLGGLRAEGIDPEMIFTGEGHAPEELTDEERRAGGAPQSRADRWNLPEWLCARFEAALGDQAEAAALALAERAPVTLRVNSAKTSREAARLGLIDEGIVSEANPVADTALTVSEGARKVAQSSAYRAGLVELQDASSQAAMAELPLTEGMRVLDFCAGGGGKALALAARAPDSVNLFAHDAAPQRMRDLPDRAARAGVRIETVHREALRHAGPFDLVLCDVPCSGSGTWRRTPEAKWRFTPDRLAELQAVQMQILKDAASHVADGGVLAYSTCSVLTEENADRIAAFQEACPEWAVQTARVWPITAGNDGFFLCLLKKSDDRHNLDV